MEPILIVEDDMNINNLLCEALTREGYVCEQAFSGTEAVLLCRMKSYSVVMLDLMLPGMTGEEVLGKIREGADVPVIVLTAKDSLDEKVGLLTAGADDYITKPFDIAEVVARVGVQLRHGRNGREEVILTHKDMELNRTTYQVTVAGTQLTKITKQEFAILELLMQHPRQVFAKEDIFEYAWNEYYMGETKTLDVHISNIRRKIKAVTQEEYIETVWGIGYRLHP